MFRACGIVGLGVLAVLCIPVAATALAAAESQPAIVQNVVFEGGITPAVAAIGDFASLTFETVCARTPIQPEGFEGVSVRFKWLRGPDQGRSFVKDIFPTKDFPADATAPVCIQDLQKSDGTFDDIARESQEYRVAISVMDYTAADGKGETGVALFKRISFRVSAEDKSVSRTCPDCKGKGKAWIEPQSETCFACEGKGSFQRDAATKVACVYCKGKGSVQRDGYWKTCTRCGGNGQATDAIEAPRLDRRGPGPKAEPPAQPLEPAKPAAQVPQSPVPVVDAAPVPPAKAAEASAARAELAGTSWKWGGYRLTFGEYGSVIVRKDQAEAANAPAEKASYFSVENLVELTMKDRFISGSWNGVTLILDGVAAVPEGGEPTPAVAPQVAPSAAAAPPRSGLAITPDETAVSLKSPEARFSVLFDGKPVPQRDLASAAIEGPYARMFTVEKPAEIPGLIVVKALPDKAEAGTYDLVVHAYGLECRAIIEILVGVTQQDARTSPASIGHEQLEINLPDTFREGQILSLDVTTQDPDRSYTWTINGRVVQDGPNAGKLEYVFSAPGAYNLRLKETSGNRTVLEWEGTTKVVAAPENSVEVKTRVSLTLTTAAGFRSYEWKVNGQAVPESRPEFTYTFKQKGPMQVECMMRNPIDQPGIAYYRAIWNVTVR